VGQSVTWGPSPKFSARPILCGQPLYIGPIYEELANAHSAYQQLH